LEAFYSFNERFAKIRSKRIKKAVKGITGKQPSDLIDDSAEELSKSRKIGREPEDSTLEISGGRDESLKSKRKSKIKQSTKRKNDTVAKGQSKKKKVNDDPSSTPGTSSKMENLQPRTQTEEQCDSKALIQNTSGRGRHRGMGIKRGRDKENLSFQSSSSSSDIDDQRPRVHVDKVPKDVRKVNLHLDFSDNEEYISSIWINLSCTCWRNKNTILSFSLSIGYIQLIHLCFWRS